MTTNEREARFVSQLDDIVIVHARARHSKVMATVLLIGFLWLVNAVLKVVQR